MTMTMLAGRLESKILYNTCRWAFQSFGDAMLLCVSLCPPLIKNNTRGLTLEQSAWMPLEKALCVSFNIAFYNDQSLLSPSVSHDCNSDRRDTKGHSNLLHCHTTEVQQHSQSCRPIVTRDTDTVVTPD